MKLGHDNMMTFMHEAMGLDAAKMLGTQKWVSMADAGIPLFKDGFIKSEKHPHAVAHGDIEFKALKGIFTEDELWMIYYGNWLRDYSQVMDTTMVGFNKADRDFLKSPKTKAPPQIIELIPTMHLKPSASTWVKILELLAAKEFVYNRKSKNSKSKGHAYNPYLKEFTRIYGELTMDMLGVYRPEEHIDNPKGLLDYSLLSDVKLKDPLTYFYHKPKGKTEEEIRVGLYKGINAKSLEIDSASKMKRYIKKDVGEDADRPSSFTYFSDQLRMAALCGKNRDGFRHLGAALHVLEDYYAHSNFVEIALIKINAQLNPMENNSNGTEIRGTINVFPWVTLSKEVKEMTDGVEKAKLIPIVTGNFGKLDAVASIVPKLKAELFPTEPTELKKLKANERTFGEKLAEIALTDLSRKEMEYKSEKHDSISTEAKLIDGLFEPTIGLRMLEEYLKLRDKISKGEANWYDKFMLIILETMHKFGENVSIPLNGLYLMLLAPSDLVIKEYQSIRFTPGTDPSHTELAKDEASHVLNPLAGLLAIEAVKEIGTEMKSVWKTKNSSIEEVIDKANIKYFTHPSEVTWMDNQVVKWAKENPDAISISENASRTGHYYNESLTMFNDLKIYFDNYWSEISKWWNVQLRKIIK